MLAPPPWRVGAPFYGESWIRPWVRILFTLLYPLELVQAVTKLTTTIMSVEPILHVTVCDKKKYKIRIEAVANTQNACPCRLDFPKCAFEVWSELDSMWFLLWNAQIFSWRKTWGCKGWEKHSPDWHKKRTVEDNAVVKQVQAHASDDYLHQWHHGKTKGTDRSHDIVYTTSLLRSLHYAAVSLSGSSSGNQFLTFLILSPRLLTYLGPASNHFIWLLMQWNLLWTVTLFGVIYFVESKSRHHFPMGSFTTL